MKMLPYLNDSSSTILKLVTAKANHMPITASHLRASHSLASHSLKTLNHTGQAFRLNQAFLCQLATGEKPHSSRFQAQGKSSGGRDRCGLRPLSRCILLTIFSFQPKSPCLQNCFLISLAAQYKTVHRVTHSDPRHTWGPFLGGLGGFINHPWRTEQSPLCWGD